jgi:uncharacterized protein (TIGR02301 family)
MSARRDAVWLWAVALALAAPPPAHGQGTKQKAPAALEAPGTAPQPEPPPPPYEPQLVRLAEIMGALAFLRDLCGDKDGGEWNARMKALIDSEAKTDARRERLAGAYNRGFRGYQTIYHVCTPAAQLIIARFLDEGGRLAHEIANRFSG